MLGRITPALAIELSSEIEQPPTLPDLQVTAMSASEQKPKQGDPVVINATVANTGAGDAAASRVELKLDDGTVLGTLDVPALAAGATAQLSQGWNTRGVSGQKVITATADSGGQVAEANEANNVGQLTVEIRGNKVKNGSFEQPNSSGNAPESWQGSSTGAGTTSYNQNSGSASDGSDSVSITGTGGNAVLAGVASWTSAPITVAPGELLTLQVDVKSVGLSSAPQVSVAYLGTAGQVLNTVTVLTAPLTTSGAFKTLSQTLVVPANVTSLRIVLGGFSPTDTRTAGTVSFDNVGLFGN
jgi:subtilase family serine protease